MSGPLAPACPLCGGPAGVLSTAVRTWVSTLGVTETAYAHCAACDFAFCATAIDEAVLAKHYGAATRWRRGGLTVEEARHLGAQVEMVTSAAGLTGSRILEVGPDAGDFLTWLCQAIGGTGFYREHGSEARALLDAAGHRPDDGGTYSLVAMRHVLEHVPDPVGYLAELPLAPDGMVFVEVPDYTDVGAGASDVFQFEHLSYFSLRALDGAARAAGYRVVRAESAQTPGYSTTPNRVLRALLVPTGRGAQTFGDWEAFAAARLDDLRRLHEVVAAGPVALYGAGARTLEYFAEFGVHPNVVALHDADPSKVGTTLFGLEVRDVASIDAGQRVVVMVVGHRREVRRFLEARGIQDVVFLTGED